MFWAQGVGMKMKQNIVTQHMGIVLLCYKWMVSFFVKYQNGAEKKMILLGNNIQSKDNIQI